MSVGLFTLERINNISELQPIYHYFLSQCAIHALRVAIQLTYCQTYFKSTSNAIGKEMLPNWPRMTQRKDNRKNFVKASNVST